MVLSCEYPADAGIQGNPTPFTHRSDLPQQLMRVQGRPAFSPFQADDASSILVGRSQVFILVTAPVLRLSNVTGHRSHPTDHKQTTTAVVVTTTAHPHSAQRGDFWSSVVTILEAPSAIATSRPMDAHWSIRAAREHEWPIRTMSSFVLALCTASGRPRSSRRLRLRLSRADTPWVHRDDWFRRPATSIAGDSRRIQASHPSPCCSFVVIRGRGPLYDHPQRAAVYPSSLAGVPYSSRNEFALVPERRGGKMALRLGGNGGFGLRPTMKGAR